MLQVLLITRVPTDQMDVFAAQIFNLLQIYPYNYPRIAQLSSHYLQPASRPGTQIEYFNAWTQQIEAFIELYKLV